MGFTALAGCGGAEVCARQPASNPINVNDAVNAQGLQGKCILGLNQNLSDFDVLLFFDLA